LAHVVLRQLDEKRAEAIAHTSRPRVQQEGLRQGRALCAAKRS
jgi:hypothetical protein